MVELWEGTRSVDPGNEVENRDHSLVYKLELKLLKIPKLTNFHVCKDASHA